MTIFDAVIFGVVEGISEFLPISSTGHLILMAQLLKIPQSDFVKSFEIAIQLGAIASVIFLYITVIDGCEIDKEIGHCVYPDHGIGTGFL
jgi:undecaprenyl-diphosphatase